MTSTRVELESIKVWRRVLGLYLEYPFVSYQRKESRRNAEASHSGLRKATRMDDRSASLFGDSRAFGQTSWWRSLF